MFENDIEKIIVTKEQLEKRVQELGREISNDYHGEELVMIGLLTGAAPFMADLARAVDLPVYYEFMSVSSYGQSSTSSGNIRILKDIQNDIAGRHVLVVEDIVDTGLTLSKILDKLARHNPASLKVCALLDKAPCRKQEIKIDYCGFTVPDEFIVGYGLDYAQKYRNLPFIGVLKKAVYAP